MKKSYSAILLGAGLTLMVACQDVSTTRASGFKGKYLTARTSLETGDYNRAIRGYANLLQTAGPLEARLRLEYAHSLLRANRFSDAAKQANVVSQIQDGDDRLAALAVLGTAQHEMARAAMAKGKRDASVRANLVSAESALKEVSRRGKKMDPLGSMAARRKVIRAELASL
jgi:hypothetical protein